MVVFVIGDFLGSENADRLRSTDREDFQNLLDTAENAIAKAEERTP